MPGGEGKTGLPCEKLPPWHGRKTQKISLPMTLPPDEEPDSWVLTALGTPDTELALALVSHLSCSTVNFRRDRCAVPTRLLVSSIISAYAEYWVNIVDGRNEGRKERRHVGILGQMHGALWKFQEISRKFQVKLLLELCCEGWVRLISGKRWGKVPRQWGVHRLWRWWSSMWGVWMTSQGARWEQLEGGQHCDHIWTGEKSLRN